MIKLVKSFVYNLLHSEIGRQLFSPFNVSGENFLFEKYPEKNFYFLVTIDVEPGYVKNSGNMCWINQDPNAFVGCSEGLQNILKVLDRYQIPATFFVSTHCFSDNPRAASTISTLHRLSVLGSEIGLHLHPKEDAVLKKITKKNYLKTSSYYYTEQEICEMLDASRQIMREKLGSETWSKLFSFRWGNWGLSSKAINPLVSQGFFTDSSACPGISGHLEKERHYDWQLAKKLSPWILNQKNYQDDTLGTGPGIVEIPNTTFSFLGKIFRTDPMLGVLFEKAFKYYYQKFQQTRNRMFFTSLTHSSEATTKNGGPTKTLMSLDRVLSKARSHKNVKFITVNQATKIFLKND